MPRLLRAIGRALRSVGGAIATHAGIERGSARKAILDHWDTDRFGVGRPDDPGGWSR